MNRTEFAEAAHGLLTDDQRRQIRELHDQVDANWHGACAAHHEGALCCADVLVGRLDNGWRRENAGGLGRTEFAAATWPVLTDQERRLLRDLHDQVDAPWLDVCIAHEEGADCCVDALAGVRRSELR